MVGMITTVVGISMLIPAGWSLYYGCSDLNGFLISSLFTMTVGFSFYYLLKPKEEIEIRYKEGFAIVTFTWLSAGIFGALPFLLTGTMNNYADAFFETMSGFTTTGASVLTDIEAVMPGVLFWRSLTHWLGGMGIVVLFVAILSTIGAGGFQIFRAESTGLSPDRIKPKISENAKVLWNTYLVLSLAQAFLIFWRKDWL
jgi:trk system potassium uptake protein TrkH